jgi:hypothetical protein
MIMTEEKIKEVKKKLQKGEPEGEIKEQLKMENYSEEEIGKAFLPHKYDMRMWYLIFAIIVSLFGLYNVIMTGGFIILICGVGLFYAYYSEKKRIGK